MEKGKLNSLYGKCITEELTNDLIFKNDIEFINRFLGIKVKYICEKLGVNQSNLKYGKVSKYKTHKARVEIEKEIARLYIKESDSYGENNTL